MTQAGRYLDGAALNPHCRGAVVGAGAATAPPSQPDRFTNLWGRSLRCCSRNIFQRSRSMPGVIKSTRNFYPFRAPLHTQISERGEKFFSVGNLEEFVIGPNPYPRDNFPRSLTRCEGRRSTSIHRVRAFSTLPPPRVSPRQRSTQRAKKLPAAELFPFAYFRVIAASLSAVQIEAGNRRDWLLLTSLSDGNPFQEPAIDTRRIFHQPSRSIIDTALPDVCLFLRVFLGDRAFRNDGSLFRSNLLSRFTREPPIRATIIPLVFGIKLKLVIMSVITIKKLGGESYERECSRRRPNAFLRPL